MKDGDSDEDMFGSSSSKKKAKSTNGKQKSIMKELEGDMEEGTDDVKITPFNLDREMQDGYEAY